MRRRYAVGKTVAAGTLRVRQEDFDFFSVPPAGESRHLLLHLADGTRLEACLSRSSAAPQRARLRFTGEQGLPLRRLIKRTLKARRGKRPWGALLFTRRPDGNFDVQVESLRQAEREFLRPERVHHLGGARPLYLLNPVCGGLERVVGEVEFVRSLPRLSAALTQALERAGWQQCKSRLPGPATGFKQGRLYLRLATEAGLVAAALLDVALQLEQRRSDLGLLLAWAESAVGRLGCASCCTPPASSRLLQLLEENPFLVRGPLALVELGPVRRLR